ncbi:MAG: PqqD family protein [Oscillospiraceae bacterium]|nr:PqqD family protein [Oscillospiraceae bacterium]
MMERTVPIRSAVGEMKIQKQVIFRCVAGESMLIPVGGTTGEYNGIFTLGGIGEDIWKMIEKGQEKEEIVTALLEEYDAEEATIRADVEEFIGKLESYGIIGH